MTAEDPTILLSSRDIINTSNQDTNNAAATTMTGGAGQRSGSGSSSIMAKRHSLMPDDLDVFDAAALFEDDFNDVFDEDNAANDFDGLDPDTTLRQSSKKKDQTASDATTTTTSSSTGDMNDNDNGDNETGDATANTANNKSDSDDDGVTEKDAKETTTTAAADGSNDDKMDTSGDGNNNDKSSTTTNTTGTAKPSETNNKKKGKKAKKRRSSAHNESAENGLPPPTWHSEAADFAHRQAMIRDIAQLLFARKRDNPSSEWMERLALKARMLENQLYKNAACLDAYLDRRTLKRRLSRLASAITKHYGKAGPPLDRRLSQQRLLLGSANFPNSRRSFTKPGNEGGAATNANPTSRRSMSRLSINSQSALSSIDESFTGLPSSAPPSANTNIASHNNGLSSIGPLSRLSAMEPLTSSNNNNSNSNGNNSNSSSSNNNKCSHNSRHRSKHNRQR